MGQPVSIAFATSRRTARPEPAFPLPIGPPLCLTPAQHHRPDARDDQRAGQDRPSSMGSIHARGLRLRCRRYGQHHSGNTRSTFRPCSAPVRPKQPRCANSGQAFADFVGIGVHCAKGSKVCDASTHARPDLLPDEPGGYDGFNGLFGSRVCKSHHQAQCAHDRSRRQCDPGFRGNIGFPGFDGMESHRLALGRADARSRYSYHLRVRLRRA